MLIGTDFLTSIQSFRTASSSSKDCSSPGPHLRLIGADAAVLSCLIIGSQYLAELLAEHQKLGPFMQVLPTCSRLLNQGEIFFIPLLTIACRSVRNLFADEISEVVSLRLGLGNLVPTML
jgi:hypothetical protein